MGMTTALTDSATLSLWAIPLLICAARICDVSLGTIRIISLSKGMKLVAAVFGFFEVAIWLFAIGQIMHNLNNFFNYFAYAAGYAAGNYFGVLIEEKLSIGMVMLRIVTRSGLQDLEQRLAGAGYVVTSLTGRSADGPVDVAITIIKRRQLSQLTKLIYGIDPTAFYVEEEIKSFRSSPPLASAPKAVRNFRAGRRVFPRLKSASPVLP